MAHIKVRREEGWVKRCKRRGARCLNEYAWVEWVAKKPNFRSETRRLAAQRRARPTPAFDVRVRLREGLLGRAAAPGS